MNFKMTYNIYIPTFKRCDNQITYFNLPKKYQEKTIFVIQEQESDHYFFKDKKTLIVSNNIGIAKTRECICKDAINNSLDYFCMLDDDLSFITRDDGKSKNSEDTDFDNIFTIMQEWLLEDRCIATSLISTRIPPSKDKSFIYNSAIGGIIFYNTNKLKSCFSNIDWLSCKILEDLYVQMQLLELGYITKTSLKYCINAGKIQTSGGCSLFRTNDLFNETICFLKKRYARYMRIRKGFYKNGGLKNSFLLKPTTYLNKLSKDSLSKNDANSYFSII